MYPRGGAGSSVHPGARCPPAGCSGGCPARRCPPPGLRFPEPGSAAAPSQPPRRRYPFPATLDSVSVPPPPSPHRPPHCDAPPGPFPSSGDEGGGGEAGSTRPLHLESGLSPSLGRSARSGCDAGGFAPPGGVRQDARGAGGCPCLPSLLPPGLGGRERRSISVSFVLAPGWEQCASQTAHLSEGAAGGGWEGCGSSGGGGSGLGGSRRGKPQRGPQSPRGVAESGGLFVSAVPGRLHSEHSRWGPADRRRSASACSGSRKEPPEEGGGGGYEPPSPRRQRGRTLRGCHGRCCRPAWGRDGACGFSPRLPEQREPGSAPRRPGSRAGARGGAALGSGRFPLGTRLGPAPSGYTDPPRLPPWGYQIS